MNDRASLIVTSNRAPPGRSKATKQLPISDLSSENHLEELAKAIAELQELNRTMLQIDQSIDQHDRVFDDPHADPWDLIEAEQRIDPLLERRSKAKFDVALAANRVIFHGACLVDEWREHDFDNAARQFSQEDGLFARVEIEWPGIPSDPIWQRLRRESCPF